MKSKRGLIFICVVILSSAAFYAYLQNKFSVQKIKNDPAPSPTETQIIKNEKKIPHFVAGRTALVEKAKKIYANKLSLGKKEDNPLGKKLDVSPISNKQSLYLPGANVTFINNLYACSQAECQKLNAVVTTNGYYIYKGEAPTRLDSKSKALVTYDKGIGQYGIWERRIIIGTKLPIDLTDTLREMKLESIERPQDKLFIAEYVGNLKALDSILSKLKNISNVSEVRLEITYSRNRGN